MALKKGVPVSPGVVVARAYCVDEVLAPREPKHLDRAALSGEAARFDRACAAAARELDAITERVSRQVGEEEAAIFLAHRLLIRDPALVAKVHASIHDQGLDAGSALHAMLEEYSELFNQIPDEYLRERMSDLRDVVGRIAAQLALDKQRPELQGDDPVIVVAPEILPSQAFMFERLPVAA